MRIAVTYDNGQIFEHFGRSENFKIYDIKSREVTSSEVISAGKNGHGALAGFLKSNNVGMLICGGIGSGAKQSLSQVGIEIYGGVKGSADKAVEHLLANKLEYNPDIECSHHGEHHHGDGHSCV